MPSYFLTGTSRGLGLAFTEELLKDPSNFVVASARNPAQSQGLQQLTTKYGKDRLATVTLDILDPSSIDTATKEAAKLLPNGLDYFISNAAVEYDSAPGFEDLDLKILEQEFHSNVSSQIGVTRAFLPLIRKSDNAEHKKIVFLTSQLGSIEIAAHLPGLIDKYSVNKAALNMVGRKWGALLKPEGITVVLIHPGWVGTDMGFRIKDWMAKNMPDNKPLTPDESAVGVVKVIREAKLEDSTSFYNYDGKTFPW